jgi:hypothetical protein
VNMPEAFLQALEKVLLDPQIWLIVLASAV